MEIEKFLELDIVLISGLPGSGKSQFAKLNFNKNNRLRVNRKEIRKTLFEMTHFGEPWKESLLEEKNEHLVKHVERKIIEQLLTNHEKVLIDNISVTKNSRNPYIETAKTHKKSIGIIFINTPVQECIKRNEGRPDSIPSNIISNLFARIELPQKEEGFKEVMIYAENPENAGKQK